MWAFFMGILIGSQMDYWLRSFIKRLLEAGLLLY